MRTTVAVKKRFPISVQELHTELKFGTWKELQINNVRDYLQKEFETADTKGVKNRWRREFCFVMKEEIGLL
jgi:hypothetical protein